MGYAGAPHLLKVTASDFDSEVLTGPEADVSVVVVDSAGAVVLPTTPLVWNDTKNRWQYTWDTTGLPPGTYKARFDLVAADGLPTPAFSRIRLQRPLVPAGGA